MRELWSLKEVEIALNMWGMSKSTIYRLKKNTKEGKLTRFKNGFIYNPEFNYFGNK